MAKNSPQPFACVVYNPIKTDLALLQRLVAQSEAQAGWAPSIFKPTAEHDAGKSAVEAALAAGAHMVIAAGGDGTVRVASEVLRGTGVPLGIVPHGTGNILARNIGMPLNDTAAAIDGAFFGENTPIDLGVATIIRPDETRSEHVFLVLAGMGLDARAIRATKSYLKKKVGWLAYVDAGLRTMFREDPLKIYYSYNGSVPKPLEVYTVMIGNCGLMPGGVLLIPDAVINDGELDIVALRPRGRFAWLNIWNKIGWENGVLRRSSTGRKIIDLVKDTKNVTYLRAREFALSVDSPEPVQLDGDDCGLAVAVSGSVDPGALILRTLKEWQPRQT